MNWAVRGSRGFGGGAGCIFAGVMWGAAWWFCAADPRKEAVATLRLGMDHRRPHLRHGDRGRARMEAMAPFLRRPTLDELGQAGIRADFERLRFPVAVHCRCALGGPRRVLSGMVRIAARNRVWHWMLRIACGIGAGMLARFLFDRYPQFFLPLYSSIESRYHDLEANPELRRVINDCGAAVVHLGYYLGFLLFEVVRRDWKNVVLILTVGIVNGAGWAALQNWEWAPEVWPGREFRVVALLGILGRDQHWRGLRPGLFSGKPQNVG